MVHGLTSATPELSPADQPLQGDDAGHAATFADLHDKEHHESVGSSLAHAALDVGECVPGLGHLFALANAATYAAQGHKTEAGLSLAAAVIPGDDQASGAMGLCRTAAHLTMGSLGVARAEQNKRQSAGE